MDGDPEMEQTRWMIFQMKLNGLWMLKRPSSSKGPNENPHHRKIAFLLSLSCRAVWCNGWESRCCMNPGTQNLVGFQHVGLGV